MKTTIGTAGAQILINGKPTYSELPRAKPSSQGLLWNQRMIQGVFDDQHDRGRFNQFGRVFDPDNNTDDLIMSLPSWHACGLRAITVGFQGGWPVHCVDVRTVDNNPFGEDGEQLDPAYARRMDRIIRAANELGMVVIVSFLYWAQALRLRDGRAIAKAVKTAASFLRENSYTNVIIEVANEYNIDLFASHPMIHASEGMACLMEMAREFSGGMPVGASGGGGMVDTEVVDASDIVLVHGNGLTRGEYVDFIEKVKKMAGDKPVVCNEDSPCFTRLDIALASGTSWGYYNNYTKQIPPSDHGITPGEDFFFARRMARAVGIPLTDLPREDQFVLQGLEPETVFHGMRAIRLASEWPEAIMKVDFLCDGQRVYTSYDEPFFCWRDTTWLAHSWTVDPAVKKWTAHVCLADGSVVEKTLVLQA